MRRDKSIKIFNTTLAQKSFEKVVGCNQLNKSNEAKDEGHWI